MDWKYMQSITPEDLGEAEKDDLFNTLVWYNSESDSHLTIDKCVTVIKLCQELLKYKGEQVETLLAELDEVAIKEAEQESKKSEDIRSSRSKRSQSSLEIDDLEERMRDLKQKLKQQFKINEKQKRDMERLQKKIFSLENENKQLQNELRVLDKDDTQSDISETIKDQHKDLIDSIHEKNKQISQLLDDIEVAEKENVVLKERLATLRDELAEATKQLNIESNLTSSVKLQIESQTEKIEKLLEELERSKEQIHELEDEKTQHNLEVERFKQDIELKIAEWKKLLCEKNDEIKKLRDNVPKLSSSSSSSTIISEQYDINQVNALTKVINEREEKIVELQEQLQTATKDIEENTKAIENLIHIKNINDGKIKELSVLIKDLKKQLKASHNRCQDIQSKLKYAEKLIKDQEGKFNELIKELDENGNIETAHILKLNKKLNVQNSYHQKQIEDLVKAANKLQHSLDGFERENLVLRERLGISEDDIVVVYSALSKQQKQKKALQQLSKENANLEEEKISLRIKNKELTKVISNLFEETDANVAIKDKDCDEIDGVMYKEIVEENEALRKGLHEILDKIHAKDATALQEIKSETLEKLLRALDVKHISGWYHPAMRLQAELHALEGTNSELREQLRLARLELSKYTDSPRIIDENQILKLDEQSLNNSEIITNLNNHLLIVLSNYKIEETTNKSLLEKIEQYRSDFAIIHQQIVMLYKQYAEEKLKFNKQEEHYENLRSEYSAKNEDLQHQLEIYSDFSKLGDNELAKREKLKEMAGKIVTLNRKCIFLENIEKKLIIELKKLRENLLNSETNYISKINKLDLEKQALLSKIEKNENLLDNTADKQELHELQNNLDNLTIKYRELSQNLVEIQTKHTKEIDILNESNNMFKKEKEELNIKLTDTYSKLHTFEDTSCNVDNSIQVLTKKLAQSEVNEITERQRGNHINNLYELVKEQLKNSEDRYTEFEKFNKEIMRKNLQLQESVKDLQDKVINYIDLSSYHELKNKCTNLLEEQANLKSEILTIKDQLELTKKRDNSINLWNSLKEYEYLNLKHQIVDLQSNSDEKAIIARLSSEVVSARLSEAECRKIIENLNKEINKYETDIEQCDKLLNEERLKNEKIFGGQKRRLSELQSIIKQQRLTYFGSVPLICETHFIDNLHKSFNDKHEAFLCLRNAQEFENDSLLLKTQLLKHISILDEIKTDSSVNNKIIQWYQDKKNLQLQELRHKRYAEFKDHQLQQALQRINNQEEQISKLEEELLQSYQKPELFLDNFNENQTKEEDVLVETLINEIEAGKECKLKMLKSEEVQTSIDLLELKDSDTLQSDLLNKLQDDLSKTRLDLEAKDKNTEELKSKITELELNISLFKTQIGDKQSQIMFYEKHILELKNKLDSANTHDVAAEKADSNDGTKSPEEIVSLKAKIGDLQQMISQKEELIINLQSLLKKDRDEHSLAASRMQEEVKKLHNMLNNQQKVSNDKESASYELRPNLTAIEQYLRQVHALEQHTTDLHANISELNSRLLASQEEIVHWKNLANETLENMESTRLRLEDKYKKESSMYKKECEKWREEIRNLNQVITSYRESANEVKIDITQLLKDKDDQIHKLTSNVRQLQKELKNQSDIEELKSDIVAEYDDYKQQILKEYETLKRKFEQLLNRERKAREEIRNLRSQLIKRPILSARSDRSDSSREQQLIKKTCSLEKENEDLKEKLERQIAINEAHRVKVDEDFDKWNKQKQWQQTAEKLKNKLKERNDEYEKLHHTCSGYRILIERLEKEKHALENRIKILKNRSINTNCNQLEALEMENSRLLSQVDMLTRKLDMQHHHSGGLAAAMLQEKLEAQERKIAILDLAAKCPVDVRSEIERLHNSLSILQKKNLQLEAQNLEMSLDLQKCRADTPHLREQIQYLESYIDVLKTENNTKHQVDNSGDHLSQNVETKKLSELERTVFILKRLVEKLQAENKRLNSGSRLCTQTSTAGSLDVLRKDYQHLKEQYGESIQKNARLEQELNLAKTSLRSLQNKPMSETLETLSQQLNEAKLQLAQKSELLDKVKVLLHRAATKEKALLEEIAGLRQAQNSSENQSMHS